MSTPRQSPLVFDQAIAERDRAMTAATDHADRESPTWSERALAFIHEYARSNRRFTTEAVRIYAHNRGLPPPPDARAWGSVVRGAAFRNWISKTIDIDNSVNPKAHYREIRVWVSLLYVRQMERIGSEAIAGYERTKLP